MGEWRKERVQRKIRKIRIKERSVQEKWRGERVVEKRKIRKIRVEERKYSIIYWTPGE